MPDAACEQCFAILSAYAALVARDQGRRDGAAATGRGVLDAGRQIGAYRSDPQRKAIAPGLGRPKQRRSAPSPDEAHAAELLKVSEARKVVCAGRQRPIGGAQAHTAANSTSRV